MHRNRISLGFGAGLTATAVLAVAGCSGTASSTAAHTANAPNTTATKATADSSAISLVADAVTKATAAGTVKISGSAAVNGASVTLSGIEQYHPSVEMSLALHGAGQDIDEIYIGHQIYIDNRTISAALGAKQWAEINLDEAGGSLGNLSSLAESGRTDDPTAQLSALIASKSVVEVGTETVQGQPTTHYSGTLNVSRFLQDNASEYQLSPSQLASLKSSLQSGGVSTETIDVWVASSGLPVQERVEAQTAAGKTDLTLDLSDWGVPVSVSAPPASEVTDITAKLNSAVANHTAG